jgi:Myb-like DNA-binding protein REB1
MGQNTSQLQPDTSSPSTGKTPADEPPSPAEGCSTPARITQFEDFKASGPLTPREVDLLEAAVENYRLANDLDQATVNNLIQDSSRSSIKATASLWAEICATLPRRQRAAVQKAARRKFHNYEKRGRWTHEEDEALGQAYEKYPQRWKAIGATIGRFPEDCRDRYRNYLKCGEAQQKDVWNAEDTKKFKAIVHQLLEKLHNDQANKMQQSGHEATGDSENDVERLLDWDIVSERMGRTRSRLQCRNKWEALRESEVRDKAIEQAYQNDGQDPQKGPSPRYLQAKTNYDRMLPGDKFKIINIIRSSLIDAERKYEFEIPWLQMQKATDDECKWTLPERKVCLQEMKKLITPPKSGGFLAYLEAMLDYLEEKYPDQMENYYEGQLDYVYTTVPKQRKGNRRSSLQKKFAQSDIRSASSSATDEEPHDMEVEEFSAVGMSTRDEEMAET